MAICKGCEKEIVFIKTKLGKQMPVNVESLYPNEKADYEAGEDLNKKYFFDPEKHISHFADCPAAVKFRRQHAN